MTLFNSGLLVLGEVPAHLAQTPPKFSAQRLAAAFGNGDRLVFAFPFTVVAEPAVSTHL